MAARLNSLNKKMYEKQSLFTLLFLSLSIYTMEKEPLIEIKTLGQLAAQKVAQQLIEQLHKSSNKLGFIAQHGLLINTPNLLPDHLDQLIGQEIVNHYPSMLKSIFQQIPPQKRNLPVNTLWGSSFSADGSRFTIECFDNSINIVDAKTTDLIATIQEDRKTPIRTVKLNHNGTLVATQMYGGPEHFCVIRNVSTNKLLKKITHKTINHFCFDHAGHYCAIVHDDLSISVYNVHDWSKQFNFEVICPETISPEIESICFTPDSCLIAATEKHLHLFDLKKPSIQPTQIKIVGKSPLLSPNGSFYSSLIKQNNYFNVSLHFCITNIKNQKTFFLKNKTKGFAERSFSGDDTIFFGETIETEPLKFWVSSPDGWKQLFCKMPSAVYHVSLNNNGTQLCGKTNDAVLFDLWHNSAEFYNTLTIRKALLIVGLYKTDSFPFEELRNKIANKKNRSEIKKTYCSFNPEVRDILMRRIDQKN